MYKLPVIGDLAEKQANASRFARPAKKNIAAALRELPASVALCRRPVLVASP